MTSSRAVTFIVFTNSIKVPLIKDPDKLKSVSSRSPPTKAPESLRLPAFPEVAEALQSSLPSAYPSRPHPGSGMKEHLSVTDVRIYILRLNPTTDGTCVRG